LLVDYLLRHGYVESAKKLANEKHIEGLVSVEVEEFEACGKVERSLREGELKNALQWCQDNKKELRKLGEESDMSLFQSNLEFELRLQQYIELLRNGNAPEAAMHARKFLAGHQDTSFVLQAAGLLCFPPDTPAEPYRTLYSRDRYTYLSSLFLKTHHTLFSLPPRPLLHIALSAGLSALKTPACHSSTLSSTGSNPASAAHDQHSSSANAFSPTSTQDSTSASMTMLNAICPICSTELNELARNVPYAHHTKSYVEPDPVVLPNGRIYGRRRLEEVNEKVGSRDGEVRDPMDLGTVFGWDDVRKVFIL
ncbi:hypothetical protein LTS18_008641, partial [Coniosporium uncinatum]